MTISSIGPTNPNPVNSLSPVASGAGATSSVDADGDHDGSRVGAVSFSPLGQVLSQLQQVQRSNPDQFKTVLTDLANKLEAMAQQDGGGQGQALSNLANKFQQAAQTGDLSSLQPAHRHHGHHHGAAAYQQTSGQTLPSQATGNGQNTSPATDSRSDVLDIIGQVMGQDFGTTGNSS